ncbi:MAG: hypothetical protein J2P30_00780 [Actinobacteria bacterium]|nr:hypothetical protein [Actinomycetota bacterium]
MTALDAITAEARAHPVRPGRAVLTVIAAVLIGIGWTAASVCFAASWCGAAVKLGWRDARAAQDPHKRRG